MIQDSPEEEKQGSGWKSAKWVKINVEVEEKKENSKVETLMVNYSEIKTATRILGKKKTNG